MSLRPAHVPKIAVSDLLPGDVILSAGAVNPSNPKIAPPDQLYMSLLDFLLKSLDEGDYTHTSFFTGVDEGKPMVVEATTDGVKHNPLSVDRDAQVLVDVYRYQSPDGHSLGDDGWPAKPVVDKALSLVGQPYSYSELLMGAIILLRVDNTAPGQEQLTKLLAERKYAAQLAEFIDKARGSTPMTCVQVATTAYYQADDSTAHKYALQVLPVGDRTPPTPAEEKCIETDLGKLQGEIRSLLGKGFSEHLATLTGGSTPVPGTVYTIGSAEIPLGTCTPRDLETSPTLKLVGNLWDTRTK